MPVQSIKSDIKNIPKLRFLGFSGAWKEDKLEDIATFLKGKGISKDDISENGINKCIRYGELYTTYNEIIKDIKSRTNILKGDSLLSKENDIIIPSSGETALDISRVSCVRENDVLLGGDLNVMRPKNNQSGEFIAYYLSNFKKRDIANLAQGNSVVHLYASNLKNLKINIPDYLEQEKISNFLESIDDWINNLKSQRENFESYKKGTMTEILTSRYRFPGFNEKWKYVKLESFAMDKKYSIVDGPFGSQMKVHEFTTEGIPVLEMEQLDNKQSIKSATRYISKEKFQTVKRSAVYSGDILISKTGTIGLLGIATAEVNPGIITSRLAKISINKNMADTAFIFHCLSYLKQDGYWTQVSQGGTMQVLGIKMIKDAPIPGISKLEQQKIGEFLTYIDKVIELKNNQIIQAEQWKKGLMQGLFI